MAILKRLQKIIFQLMPGTKPKLHLPGATPTFAKQRKENHGCLHFFVWRLACPPLSVAKDKTTKKSIVAGSLFCGSAVHRLALGISWPPASEYHWGTLDYKLSSHRI